LLGGTPMLAYVSTADCGDRLYTCCPSEPCSPGGVAGSGIDHQRDARRQIYAGDGIGPMTGREALESGLRLKAWVAPEPDCRRRADRRLPHPTDTAEIPASFKVGCDGDMLIVDRPPWRRSP
jgi:hypothetical protein